MIARPPMIPLASGVSFVDLEFLGYRHVIAAGVVQGPDGVAIVDPGPSTTLSTLKARLADAGASPRDVTALLITHIHLDHAGCTGTLVREFPGIRVYVHEKGAPHLVDPSRLMSSAARLYGTEMDRLWGACEPVPPSAISVLAGGESIRVGGRQWRVLHTPGHASHHVAFVDADTGLAFVGDTAGVKVAAGGFVLPPTPPPDIDLEAWRESLLLIESLRPSTLFLTHFGPHGSPPAHLAELRAHIDMVGRLSRTSLDLEGDDASRETWFMNAVREELRVRATEEDVRAAETAARLDLCWKGLARYWRKRQNV